MSIHEVKTAHGTTWEVRWRETDYNELANPERPWVGAPPFALRAGRTFKTRQRSFRAGHREAARTIDRAVSHAATMWDHRNYAVRWNHEQRIAYDVAVIFARSKGEPVRNVSGDVMTAPPRMNVGDDPEPREVAAQELAEWRAHYEPAGVTPEAQAIYYELAKVHNDLVEIPYRTVADEDRAEFLAAVKALRPVREDAERRLRALGFDTVTTDRDREREAAHEADLLSEGYVKQADGTWERPEAA